MNGVLGACGASNGTRPGGVHLPLQLLSRPCSILLAALPARVLPTGAAQTGFPWLRTLCHAGVCILYAAAQPPRSLLVQHCLQDERSASASTRTAAAVGML